MRGLRVGIAIVAGVAQACAPPARAASDELPLDSAVVQLRVGSADDEATAFASISNVAAAPSGARVYVLDSQSREVHVFDRDGTPLRAIGGPGQGPGEFGNPVAFGVMRDTLWVLDSFTFGFSFFDLNGTYFDDLRPMWLAPQSPLDRPPTPRNFLADGTLMGGVRTRSDDVVDGLVTRSPVLLLNRDGEALDTLAWRSMVNTALRIQHPDPEKRRGALHTMQPFGGSWPQHFSALDPSVVRVEAGDEGAAATLVATGFDGVERWRVPVGWAPVPVTDAMVDDAVEMILEFATQAPSFPGISTGQLREWTLEALYRPEVLTPVEGIERSSDGGIWLRKRQGDPNDPVIWREFSDDGRALRDVVVPAGVRVQSIVGDDFWGVEHDDLDVPYLVRLGVGGPARPS